MDPISKFASSDIFQNTCLNNIVPDLRQVIDEYLNSQYPFAIGVHRKEYFGYRLITKEDLKNNIFMSFLGDHYQKNNGFLSLDNFLGFYLCGDNIDLCTRTEPLKIIGSSIDAPNFLKIGTINLITERFSEEKYDIKDMKYSSHYRYQHDVGLFILTNHKF